MIKGVNHQMIEVTRTESPYFERAFLVLRPDCADPSLTSLEEETRRVLAAAGGYSALMRNRRRIRLHRLIWSLIGGAVGVLLGLLLSKIFFG